MIETLGSLTHAQLKRFQTWGPIFYQQITTQHWQVGPHEIKLYYAKELADHLDPNDLGLRIWPGTHAMVHLLLKLAGHLGVKGAYFLVSMGQVEVEQLQNYWK